MPLCTITFKKWELLKISVQYLHHQSTSGWLAAPVVNYTSHALHHKVHHSWLMHPGLLSGCPCMRWNHKLLSEKAAYLTFHLWCMLTSASSVPLYYYYPRLKYSKTQISKKNKIKLILALIPFRNKISITAKFF